MTGSGILQVLLRHAVSCKGFLEQMSCFGTYLCHDKEKDERIYHQHLAARHFFVVPKDGIQCMLTFSGSSLGFLGGYNDATFHTSELQLQADLAHEYSGC